MVVVVVVCVCVCVCVWGVICHRRHPTSSNGKLGRFVIYIFFCLLHFKYNPVRTRNRGVGVSGMKQC